ncbi:hypothetical protein BDI4_1080084 [Burkholderia diffusa]|nr:hypothetical protein BDI4_1080084 [Burkholderia diffusa]
MLVGLALVLVAMFAFGFYWLATKDRSARPTTPTPTPSAPVAAEEHGEWEAHAAYPAHVLRAASFTQQSFGMHTGHDQPWP